MEQAIDTTPPDVQEFWDEEPGPYQVLFDTVFEVLWVLLIQDFLHSLLNWLMPEQEEDLEEDFVSIS